MRRLGALGTLLNPTRLEVRAAFTSPRMRPNGIFDKNARFRRRDISIAFDIFWLTCLQLHSSLPFTWKKKLTMAVDTVHGSHQQCTMRHHLYEETGARCGAWVSSRGRVEKATRVHITKYAQQ